MIFLRALRPRLHYVHVVELFPFTALAVFVVSSSVSAERPNVLWISSEDNGPHLGCYGDPNANTPNLEVHWGQVET